MNYKSIKVGGLYRHEGFSGRVVVRALRPPQRTFDKKDGILYCEVVEGNRDFRKGWRMNVYTSSLVCEHTSSHTNLQELAIVELNLTNLQIVALNEIAANIANGKDTYASNADSLSEQEDKYLRAWLGNEGILVKEEMAEG